MADTAKRKYVMGHRLTVKELLYRLGLDLSEQIGPDDEKALAKEVIQPLGISPQLARTEEAFELASEPFEDKDKPRLVVVAESSWNEETFEFEPAKRRLKKVTKEGGR